MKYIEFGNYLHELRAKKGMSQENLSVLSEIPIRKIEKWEVGTSLPDLKESYKLAKALDESFEVFARKMNAFISEKEDSKITMTLYTLARYRYVFYILSAFIMVGIGITYMLFSPETVPAKTFILIENIFIFPIICLLIYIPFKPKLNALNPLEENLLKVIFFLLLYLIFASVFFMADFFINGCVKLDSKLFVVFYLINLAIYICSDNFKNYYYIEKK